MKIEALYPELCNLFGDAMNAEYLHRAVPNAEFLKTSLKDSPAFLNGDVDIVYMGSMTENGQSIAAGLLMPFRERIIELVDAGKVFLITGNALELFGNSIENEDGSFFETLGLFDLYSKRQMMRRYSSIYLGSFDGTGFNGESAGEMDIVGFKSQFSFLYDDVGGVGAPALFHTKRGAGRMPGQVEEGVRLNNFFGTSMLGPLLLINPPFTRYLLGLLGARGSELPYEPEAMTAYEARVSEFKNPKTGAEYG